MKTNKQKVNLILDMLLFAGFILCFFLDLTGMIAHQWLGVILGGAALIHLLVHNQWVSNAILRFSNLQSRPQILFLLDVAVALGFVGILSTGLVISTWLNLSLNGYTTWLNLHIAFSLETLFFLVVKIGFHWRWISNTFKKLFEKRPFKSLPDTQMAVDRSTPPLVSKSTVNQMSRREFLAVMGVTSVASILAVSSLLKETQTVAEAQSDTTQTVSSQSSIPVGSSGSISASTEAASTATSALNPTQVPTVQPTTAYACSIRCNKRCSFPGRCGRYVDSNGNGKCDNGECL